jgi:PAS domain S-box-containing protein
VKTVEKKYVNIAFILAFIILVLINIITYMNIRLHLDDESVLKEALSSIQLSESCLSKITEAETSRRGYFITNDSEFLEQYHDAIKKLDSIIVILKTNNYKNTRQKDIVDNLVILTASRKKEWEESIEMQELGKHDVKTQISFTTKGKELMNRIRTLINSFQEEERKITGDRINTADKSASYTLISLIAGSFVAYILLITGFIFLNRNISIRKLTEQSLMESRNWFATTLQSIGEGVIVTSKISDIVYMNKVAEEITGWKESEAKGLVLDHIFNLVDENSGKKTDLKTPLKSRISLKTKNNILIPIDYAESEIKQEDDKSLGKVFVFRDVSLNRKAEEELLESKRFIQRIADSIPSVIYIYNLKELKLIYVNYKVFDLLGYSSEYVINMGGDFFGKLIHPDDMENLKKMYQKFAYAKDKDIIDYEYRIKNSKGEWKIFRSYDVVFSRDSSGIATEILGTTMDVNEKKKMEEEIKNYSGHLEDLVEKRTKELQRINEKLKKEIEERAKAESIIVEAEEKFRSLVENSLVGIYIIQDENYKYVNPKYEEIFGYEPGELIGTYSYDRVHPDYINIVKDNINKRLNNEIDSIQYVLKGIKKDGSLIDVEVRGTKMLYGGKISIIGSMLDITERLRTENEINRSRQKLLFHIQQTPLGVIEWDYDSNVVEWNPSAEKIFGYTKEEALGKHSSFLIPEYIRADIDKEVWKELLNREGGTRSTNENVKKDGKIILCEWYNTPLVDDKGNVIGVASLVQDITERKLFEQAIVNQQRFLKKVIDTNPNFVFAKDWDGKFTMVNKAVADNYGTTVDGLIGKSDADFNPNKKEVEHFLNDDREVISGKIKKNIAEEVVYNSQTGESKWYQTIKVPLVTHEGEMQVLGVATDITARKLAEELTKKSLHEKEILLKEIHHRVKNNLQIIVSLLKLQAKYVHDQQDLALFGNSRSRVETMSMIHEKLYRNKDLSNIDLGNYLTDLSYNIINSHLKEPVSIKLDFKSENILLGIDTAIPCGLAFNELMLCIINFSICSTESKFIGVEICKSNGEIKIKVKDNGKGINPVLDTTSPDSLGMQLIEMLVKQLDGEMSLSCENGTDFEMSFKEITYKERI